MFSHAARARRSSSSKHSATRNRLLRSEALEPRTLLSGTGFSSAFIPPANVVGAKAAANTAPTIAQPISINGNATVTGKTAALSVLGIDDGGQANLTYVWSVTTTPTGGTATFSSNGSNAAHSSTVTFSMAGTYAITVKIVDAGGLSVSGVKSVVVSPTLTSIKYPTTATLIVSGTTLQPTMPAFLDQFGNAMTTPPALTWSTVTQPSGAPAPTFTTSGGSTTITFGQAGGYMFQAKGTTLATVSFVTIVTVNQTLSSIAVTPNTVTVQQGFDQKFTAQSLDQFKKPITVQSTFTWSSSGGTVNSAGVFTAPSKIGSYTVTAKCGTVTGTAAVTVQASPGWNTAALGKLVQSLDLDGSLSRQDMMQILNSVVNSGPVTAGELTDLKNMLGQATALGIPGYVQALAGDIINGNAANATYQGSVLGNLAVGSSSVQLTKLINKWFLGTDHPVLCNTSLIYTSTAGTLFPHTPSHTDEYQGMLGDCYLITALGTLADSNPAAIQNMIIDNGDGTFTVRFYSGPLGVINNGSGAISAGFTNNQGTADYITVDRMLPASSLGVLAYADSGAKCSNTANSLWIPLIEKAYAQWNQTGKEGRDGTIAFASIQGGWMATIDAQVLGYNATDYIMTTTAEQVAVNALAAKQAVSIGTQNWTATTNLGLYANHAYAITAYNAKTDTFTLYNPWGSNQPGQLTWAQLQATCTQLCVCNITGTIPFLTSTRAAAAASQPAVGQGSGDIRHASLVDLALSSGAFDVR